MMQAIHLGGKRVRHTGEGVQDNQIPGEFRPDDGLRQRTADMQGSLAGRVLLRHDIAVTAAPGHDLDQLQLADVAGNSRLRDVKALAAEVFNQFILRFDLMLGNNLNYLLQTVLFHVVLIPFGVYFHLFVFILCCFAGQRPLREAPIRRAGGFRRLPL